MKSYHGFLVVELLPLLLDVLDVLFNFDLLFPALQRIGIQEFAIESSDFLGILEQFFVGFCQLLFLLFLLEAPLFLIDFPPFQLLLLKLPVAFLLLTFFEVLGVIGPLISPLLALLILMHRDVVLVLN